MLISPQIIQAVPNALGALCLNEVGQTQLARRPSIIPGIFSVFTSERHVKVLLEKENAVLIGTSIDELIRHHPSLKGAVFDALKSTISKIEELGQAFEIPEGLRQWYSLVPVASTKVALDNDVSMENVESASIIEVSHDKTDLHDDDDEDDSQDPKAHDNYVVSFIDVLGRVRCIVLL